MGVEPIALLRLNIAQFFAVVRGFRDRKAMEENHFRRLYYLLYSVHRDPKKAVVPAYELWPIPEMDAGVIPSEEKLEEQEFIKSELMKLWGVSEN